MIITLEQFKYNAYNQPSYVYKATQGEVTRYANTRERAIEECLNGYVTTVIGKLKAILRKFNN